MHDGRLLHVGPRRRIHAVPACARVALRPEDLRVGADGVAVRAIETRFMGDRTRLTLAAVAAPQVELRAYADPGVAEGWEPLRVAVKSGWILPGA